MASVTPALRCLLFLVLIIGGIETRNHHAHRHERSRLRRQHQYDEPNIYVIEDEGGGTLESGDWGPWSEPSPCSRTCGGGVSSQTRECSPYASSPCYGGKKRYFSCNTEECPGGENFRSEQCAEYNRVPFQGITYSWIPYKKAEEKCALNCMPVGERFYYRHKEQVIDGTPCSDEGRNICVNGKCLEVGCDNLLGSKMREDTCRVCGGDGSSCTTKSGVIEKNAQRIGYEDLFLIPSGATNINVRERRPSNNYLAVRNKTGFFYLNGNWKIDYSQSLRFAGTVFVYERKSFPFLASESLTALGPTNEAIYIAMLYQEPNPGIEYTYSVPKGSFQETPNEGYVWSYDSFSECNVTCGQGYQTRRVWCSQGRNEVDPDLCDSGSEPTSVNICSRPACPAKWFTSDWSRCSAPCGEKGTRTRQVICQQEVGLGAVRVDESQCPEPVPQSSEECQEFGPCPTWHVGPWKPCDHLCGEGKQTRELHCYKKVNGVIELLSENACHDEKPESEKACNLRPCEGLDWITSDWSGCSEKCGVTFETRTAQCANEKGIVFNSSMCEESLKPELVRNCTVTPCASQWFASQWSPCSAKCGTGIQSRDVFCVSLEDNTLNKVEDSKCDPKLKYESTKECKVEDECKGEWFAGPFGECSKPCGGGIQERKVLCIKNNKTVNLAECDESKIILRIENCNKEPCGEDEIMPVETTQTIMEESSEECDSDYDYEDGSEEVSTDGILKFTDEIEDGSGFGADEFMTTLLGSSEKGSTSGETTESTLLTSVGSSESIATDFLGDDAASGSSSGSTDSSVTTESDSSDMTTSGSSMSGADSSEASSVSGASSVDGASSVGGASSVTGASSVSGDVSESESSKVESTSESVTSDTTDSSSTDSSSMSSSDSSTTDSSTTDSSSDASSSSSSNATLPENVSTTEASGSTSSILDMISASISSLMTDSQSETTTSSDLSTVTDSDVTGTSVSGEPESTVTGESGTTGSDTTGSASSSETDLTSVSGETSSSEIEMSSTESSSTDSSSVSTTEMSGSTDWTLAVFNVTTQSPIDAAITKEQTMKKCKRKKGKSKCSKSKFGCCPDKTTEAKGPFGKGCSVPKTCKESKHGCCLDGVSAAKGPKYKGCPKPNCDQTLFGCCKDKTTPSRGNNYEGCPAEPTTIVDCMKSKFGCCPDGILSAMGPNNAGCVCDTCKPCNQTEHGCCPDKVTAATGPNMEGCNIIKEPDCGKSKHGCCPNGISAAEDADKKGCKSCKETEFGCCPDGVKSARGDNGFGCDPPCARGPFGCCHDNRTMAHGPNQEGCCLQYEFGCCPDLITPAEGPRNQGCECKNAAFGCCPDNRTPAKGYNNEGCGCKHTEHGCCPDNLTPAEGPNFDGCSCHTFQFGCCPDGVTKITGPYDTSCRCEATPNGCCSDGVTPKPNPNENCSCESTKYGCCPDGYTEAQGEKFEGCENVEPKGEVCSLPRDPGTCRDFRIVYYYDMRYGGCSRFWYGGCGGNLNRFNTIEECQQHCIFPPGKDACTLPMHAGLCHGNHPSWFFDTNSKRCQEFNHTGCLGNNNRFDTREHCENMCGSQEHLDPCLQSLEPGPCQGQYNRWYFNKETKTCSEFTYGGCKGTQNNFISEAACQYKCLKPASSLTEVCFEPLQRGNCSEEIPKWHYSTRDRKCMPFYYSGCDGNQNNFDSREECERSCPVPRERDICTLPAVGGGCSNYTSRFYYDTAKKSCQHFYYGGCEGNENNFLTEYECTRKCNKQAEPPSEPFTQEMCLLPPRDPGNCQEKVRRYSYNPRTGYCESFAYSGCGGNRNNFESDNECEQSCGHLREKVYEPEPPQRPPPPPPGPPSKPRPYSRICYASADPGPCLEQIPSWYFDSTSGTCAQFIYGGCEGNGNRFMSEEQCERQCGEYRLQDACVGYPVSGNTCADPETKYYFNEEKQICESFVYNGCEGTSNRFSTISECESVCLRNIEPKVPKGKNSRGAFEVCNQPLETGPCDKHITRWMYDDRERTCLSFLYTGCGGNLNNFETNEECVEYCGTNDIDVDDKVSKGCQSLEETCRGLQCDYGIERWVDENDCENCRCYNPCDVEPNPCGHRSLCHVERLYDEQTGATQFRPTCESTEPQNHRGFCPQVLPESPSCDNNCEYDSDCRDDEKCCYNGCGMTCTISVSEQVTQGPDTYIVPASISDETPTYAEEEEGNLATFECNADGSPAPKVEWRRDNEIINSTTGGKYRVSNSGKLEIIGLERSDEGEYICEADNGGGAPATRRYTLTVKAGTPRQVTVVNNPDEKELIATLNRPAVLRCYAIGYPSPTVSWWRGDKVLPYRGEGVEQRRDNSLYIQTVTPKHLGFYTCQLYNGVGSAASFTLTLKMYGPIDSYDPNDITYNPFLVPSPIRPPVDDRPRPPPYHPQDKVPVMVNISSTTQEFATGANVSMNCAQTAGNPPPEFRWLKDEEEIESTNRIIVQDNRLLITNAQPEDSGDYTCIGYNRYSQARSSVKITIKSNILPPNCTDSPYFANCQLIVKANYCNHEYYAKFCCKSCTEAGKLGSPSDYRKKRSVADFIRMRRSNYILPSRTDMHSPKKIRINKL